MHRLKRWINEAVSSYEEQLKENPIETIAISLSWVFVIIIGLMAVLAYIKFIIDGGYSLSVARIKENGAFASANFTTGTIHIISNNVVWIILGIIIGVQTIVSIILLFAEKEIWKWILFVIDLIAIVFCFVKMVTGQNNSMSEEMRLIYSVVTLIAIIVFFKLLIDSDGSISCRRIRISSISYYIGINFIIGKYIGDWCISRSDYNHRNIGYRRNIW